MSALKLCCSQLRSDNEALIRKSQDGMAAMQSKVEKEFTVDDHLEVDLHGHDDATTATTRLQNMSIMSQSSSRPPLVTSQDYLPVRLLY